MDFFKPIEGGNALLVNNGTYMETLLYERGSKVFAKLGTGYIKLWPSGGTSKKSVFWSELNSDTGEITTEGCDLVHTPRKSRGNRKIAAVS